MADIDIAKMRAGFLHVFGPKGNTGISTSKFLETVPDILRPKCTVDSIKVSKAPTLLKGVKPRASLIKDVVEIAKKVT